jgi:hypothetical protein
VREQTGRGVIVVPHEECGFKPLVDLRIELRNGAIDTLTSKQGGDCVRALVMATEPGQLGYLMLGLNPAYRISETGELGFRATAERGTVTVGFGNNADLGGTLSVPYTFPIVLTDATLEVDGTTIVRNGELVVPNQGPENR